MTRAHVLSNGHYSVLLTPAGGGYAALDGYALTRWAPDPTCETQGCFGFVRDLESGEFWSVTAAPGAGSGKSGQVQMTAERVVHTGSCHGIAARIETFVATHFNGEVRRITLTNLEPRARRLDLTTYTELSLNTPAADQAHPAFSKLFVQTGFDEERAALLAWRRQRSPEDRALWVGQKLTGGADLTYETDRMRFIGRARSLADPAALLRSEALSGSIGTVLDPLFAQRVPLTLAAGASVTLELITVAAANRADLERAFDDAAAVAPARADSSAAIEGLGLPPAWLAGIAFDAADTDWTMSTARMPQPLPPEPANYGAFSADGSEYVIDVAATLAPTPQPWINVIANEQFGCLFSERGAGYTWSQNSRENRITPWSNDPVTDPHGEAIFVRDETADTFWSVLPGPAPAPVVYEVRHGFGYSRVKHSVRDLRIDACIFVPRGDSVRFVRVSIANDAAVPRTLTLFSYAQLVLGSMPADTRTAVVTSYDEADAIIFATNPARAEFAGRVTFSAACMPACEQRTASGNRGAFLGYNDVRAPAALRSRAPLDGCFGAGLDPCAAQQFVVRMAAGATLECAFLLGEAENEAAARACVAKYQDTAAIDVAFAELTSYWQHLLSAVHIATPEPALDLMANGWLAYQDLACRMWARSAFQQSGGAFGFRDQLQDAAALLYLDPRITRAQILLHAAHQFVEGDVLHWWHPPTSKGIRTRFSDDLLWLPYITLFYVDATGDRAILDENARYIKGPPLAPAEDELFVYPEDSGTAGSIYDHCCRAIDRSLTSGAHGLPLMGVGDWNDGMNRVGRAGQGESVWLGFFLFDILEHFTATCEARGDQARTQRYRSYQQQLAHALNDAGWDGAWYRRAYYDDGTPLGSTQSDEARIDALAQAWAVLSHAAPEARAESAMAAMERQLVDRHDGLIRLLTPPFDRTTHDPGYIKGYVPGVRENGGQYTHAALWAVRALAEMGEIEHAAPLLAMLSPVSHTGTRAQVLVYQGEPYVIAADVYGMPPHVGRAGWTWYTGSAGWMLRVILESVLGLELDHGERIKLRPCIPESWSGFTLQYRFPDGTTYRFVVEQTDDDTQVDAPGLAASIADGAVVVAIVHDTQIHEVRVVLGDDVGPIYKPAPLLRTTSV